MSAHGRGHRPDPPEVAARRKGFHLLKAQRGFDASSLPAKVDLSPYVTGAGGPGIFDQGSTGSCEGHAHAGAITARFAALGAPIPVVSPIGIYCLARCIGRQANRDGTLPPLTDDGTEPSLAISAVETWGVTSADAWGGFPADPATINAEPSLAELEDASDFRLLGAYFLQHSGDQKVVDIMTALAAGYPVVIALPASGQAFNDYTGGVMGALSGPIDHANYIVGYELTTPGNYGSVIVKCVNSWGVGWGESGMYRANRHFVDQLEDCCAIDVAPASAGSKER